MSQDSDSCDGSEYETAIAASAFAIATLEEEEAAIAAAAFGIATLEEEPGKTYRSVNSSIQRFQGVFLFFFWVLFLCVSILISIVWLSGNGPQTCVYSFKSPLFLRRTGFSFCKKSKLKVVILSPSWN